MGGLSEEAALRKLVSPEPISFEELDDIFTAFGFIASMPGGVMWYRHSTYDAGEFRAEPTYRFSTLSDAQRTIVWRMIERVRDLRDLEGLL
jgi:hypothetical protein